MENEKFAVTEEIFTYKNHECICIFSVRGYRCGYVSVDDNVDAENYMGLDINCHCGLTFGGELPYDYGQTKNKYIGFDCGHGCDGDDLEQAVRYGLLNEKEYELAKSYILPFDNPIRTLQYVKDNCKYIVDQLEK